MIAHAGKDDKKLTLWPYAMAQCIRIHNALPTRGHSPPVAPAQLLDPEVVPDLSVFKVMFCDGYCSIQDDEIPTKVSNSRIKCVNLGYCPERKCDIVYLPEINRVTQSNDTDWNERSFSSFGPAAKSIKQQQRELPHARRDADTISPSRARRRRTEPLWSWRASSSTRSPKASLRASPRARRLQLSRHLLLHVHGAAELVG